MPDFPGQPCASAGIQPLPNRTTYDRGKDWVPASAGTNGGCKSDRRDAERYFDAAKRR